ncbi:MAG TPA: serine hydrolase [Beijerinckiaceae bacterium]
MALGCVQRSGGHWVAVSGLAAVAASLLVVTATPAEAARRKARGGGYNPPYANIVIDAKTGRVLHAVNEDALRHPASVTKVMTLYLLFEALEKGKVSLDTPLRVSANAARQSPSKLYLDAGDTISVEDAIKALVTKSANDVAVTVAENLGGSEEDFAEQMTRKARALGMNRTVYRNASGLPDAEQVTTARDLTILGRAIQDRFPRYYRYFQTRTFNFAGASYKNHNKLLGRVEGVDGIKTGFTRMSGFNLLTNVKTDDRHIVAVVLGGRSGASRDQIMAGLVRTTLPRAYAGARTLPSAAEAAQVAEAPRPARVADVETTATTPSPKAVAKPLDLNAMRPVVASAAGASSTMTPTSGLRWSSGPQPAPTAARAYAAVETSAKAAPPLPLAGPEKDRKIEARLPAVDVAPAARAAALEARTESKPEPKREAAKEATKPAVTPSAWVIQLGATDEEEKAKAILDQARSAGARALAKASPFTEKVARDGATLFRARFSGFEDPDSAQEACKSLKKSGFACFATRS